MVSYLMAFLAFLLSVLVSLVGGRAASCCVCSNLCCCFVCGLVGLLSVVPFVKAFMAGGAYAGWPGYTGLFNYGRHWRLAGKARGRKKRMVAVVRYLVFVLLLSWAMVDDFRKQEIADAVPAGLVAYAFMSGLSGEGLSLREACLGAFIGAGLMFILAVVSTMGGGDIKLMGALGAWFGVKVLDTFMLSFVVGLFPCAILLHLLPGHKASRAFWPCHSFGFVYADVWRG